MSTPLWLVRLIKMGFPYSSLGARLTRVPVLGRGIERMLFEGDDLMLLPATRVVAVGEGVPESPSEVVPWQVVEQFVEKAGFLWVMNTCICRESMGCEDYPIDLGCLFMGEAARRINPALGRPVSKEEALEHLRQCREAGLFHLVGRNKVDAVWLNIRPADRLLTVCSCCTCCCLWRILPVVSESVSSQMTRMPGLEVRVTDACVGCGTCLAAECLAGALSVGERATISDECRGCGRCVGLCPEGAIEIRFEGADDFVASAVERLSARVDVT